MKIRTYFNTIVFSIFFLQIILVSAAGAVNKLMPLGDSITWDDRSNDQRSDGEKIAYRYRLWQLLTDAGYDFDFVGSENTGFDIIPDGDGDNEGHPGWTAKEIVDGRPVTDPGAGNLSVWLDDEEPNIVLLHIGTNDISNNSEDWNDVEAILEVIDDYETASGKAVWVVLSLIIDRSCSTDAQPCPNSLDTTDFNIDVENNVFIPRQAAGDKIMLVDMQNDAGIDYTNQSIGGDMWDNLHPYEQGETGYAKMGALWFNGGLVNILPQANAGLDQTVDELESVPLDGSASTDPKGGTLSYQWVQTGGTPVVDLLPDDQAEQPTFDAPNVGPSGETLTFQLTVTDEDGLVSADTVDIVVQNILPQADAGTDQTVNESAIVTLDASESVGVGLSYQWTQTAGTGVVLSDPFAVQPSFTAPVVGASGEILTFELTVTDDDGLLSSDTMSVTVKDNPIAPTADAGSDQNVTEGDPVTLDGSGSSDADGAIDTYVWVQETGTPVTLSGASTTPTATFTAPAVDSAGETLTFQLTVTDNDGLSSSDTMSVTINNNPIAPTADAGIDQTVTEGDPVTLDGSSSSDADGTIETYLWEQETGTPVTLPSASTTPTATFTAPAVDSAGETLTFRLTVTDNDGLSSSDTMSVTVNNSLIAPTADAGDDQTVTEGDPVTLDGSGSSDAYGTIETYLWEQETGTPVTLPGASTTPTATFTAPVVDSAGETLAFRLTVTDDDGLSSSDTVSVTVNNNPLAPTADAGGDQDVDEFDTVDLDASGSSTPKNGTLTYLWAQTAGTSDVDLLPDDQAVQPTFTAPDVGPTGEILTFQLTVTDVDGLKSTDTVSITVHNPTSSDGGGGGGGGGGCFIATAANGSPMALPGKVLRALSSQFTKVNWIWRMPGDISLSAPSPEQAATLTIVITMVVLISSWVAITMRKPRIRCQKH